MDTGIEYATISISDTVSYTGTRPSYAPDGIPVRFDVTTYDYSDTFDWASIPAETPVIDWRTVEHSKVWRVGIKPTYATHADKLAACRLAGVPVHTAAYYLPTGVSTLSPSNE